MKITKPLHWIVNAMIVGGAILAFESSRAQTNAPDSQSIQDLRQQIQDLDQKLKILERKAELEKDSLVETKKTSPTVTVGSDGLTVRSADSNFVARIHGYVQVDGRFYLGSSQIPAHDTFLLRRVRPIFEGTVFEKFDYRLMLDFGQGDVSGSSAANQAVVQDAYVNARLWPEFQIQAGKFKEPVGLERLQSGANLLFVERAYPTLLVANRDVGIQLQGSLFQGTLSYAAGVFNGVPDGGSDDFEIADNDKDFAGRIFANPFKNTDYTFLKGLGVGLAGTDGNQKGALRTYLSPGQQTIFSYLTGAGTSASTPNVTADGQHWRFTPQGYYYVGPFGLLTEYVISTQEVRRDTGGMPTFGQVENKAWQVAGSYFVTGEENSYKPVAPSRPLDFHGDGWGALELVARISQLELDSNNFPLFASPTKSASKATSWAVGANWVLNKNIKLTLDYEQTQFEGGKNNVVTANDEKVILSQIQFSF